MRAYKRFVAPLVAIVDMQNFLEFGFVTYRTGYENETAWEEAINSLKEILNTQMEAPWMGTGLELIEDRLVMAVEDEKETLGGAGFEECRKMFKVLSKEQDVPPGLNVGMVLVIDEGSIKSLAEPEGGMQHVWAVDVGFEKGKAGNPEGYEGVFKVSVHALLHSLFVGLEGGMEPVDIWKLLQRKERAVVEVEGGHDEL